MKYMKYYQHYMKIAEVELQMGMAAMQEKFALIQDQGLLAIEESICSELGDSVHPDRIQRDSNA